jgi:hypothetical protein
MKSHMPTIIRERNHVDHLLSIMCPSTHKHHKSTDDLHIKLLAIMHMEWQ